MKKGLIFSIMGCALLTLAHSTTITVSMPDEDQPRPGIAIAGSRTFFESITLTTDRPTALSGMSIAKGGSAPLNIFSKIGIMERNKVIAETDEILTGEATTILGPIVLLPNNPRTFVLFGDVRKDITNPNGQVQITRLTITNLIIDENRVAISGTFLPGTQYFLLTESGLSIGKVIVSNSVISTNNIPRGATNAIIGGFKLLVTNESVLLREFPIEVYLSGFFTNTLPSGNTNGTGNTNGGGGTVTNPPPTSTNGFSLTLSPTNINTEPLQVNWVAPADRNVLNDMIAIFASGAPNNHLYIIAHIILGFGQNTGSTLFFPGIYAIDAGAYEVRYLRSGDRQIMAVAPFSIRRSGGIFQRKNMARQKLSLSALASASGGVLPSTIPFQSLVLEYGTNRAGAAKSTLVEDDIPHYVVTFTNILLAVRENNLFLRANIGTGASAGSSITLATIPDEWGPVEGMRHGFRLLPEASDNQEIIVSDSVYIDATNATSIASIARIAEIKVVNSILKLQTNGRGNPRYHVDTSTDLVHWEPVPYVPPADPLVRNYSFPTSEKPMQFFRVVTE